MNESNTVLKNNYPNNSMCLFFVLTILNKKKALEHTKLLIKIIFAYLYFLATFIIDSCYKLAQQRLAIISKILQKPKS